MINGNRRTLAHSWVTLLVLTMVRELLKLQVCVYLKVTGTEQQGTTVSVNGLCLMFVPLRPVSMKLSRLTSGLVGK
ncbi:hypothetical protein D3C79_1076180 [compost metagenome]